MRRFGLFMIVAAMFASLQPAHATTTVTIDIIGFQYKWAGRITTVPTSATVGSPDLAGTPMAAPTVHRGDVVQFTNNDPMMHTIQTTVKTVDGLRFVFNPLPVGALGDHKSFTVPLKAPLGKIFFTTAEYEGMMGYINVVA